MLAFSAHGDLPLGDAPPIYIPEPTVPCNMTAITLLRSAMTKVGTTYYGGDAPSGGDFTHGQTFTITGTGFGTKATAEPLVYDDFEAGTLAAGIDGQAPTNRAIGGAWTWDSNTSDSLLPEYSNTVLRPNSSRSAHMRYEGNNYNNSLEINHVLANTGDAAYFSFWQYLDKTSVGWTRNWKPWVVYGSAGVYPSAYIGFGEVGSDPTVRNAIQDTGVNEVTLWGDVDIDDIEGEWIRHEMYLVQSSAGNADGEWHHTIHRSGVPSITVAESEVAYETRGGSDYWQQWHFGSYHATDTNSAEASVYMDQIYFDSTRQRVELGDAATWAACTKREVQVATSWSDTSISIDANAGAFSNGDTAYLYIIGADGNPTDTNGISVGVTV